MSNWRYGTYTGYYYPSHILFLEFETRKKLSEDIFGIIEVLSVGADQVRND